MPDVNSRNMEVYLVLDNYDPLADLETPPV